MRIFGGISTSGPYLGVGLFGGRSRCCPSSRREQRRRDRAAALRKAAESKRRSVVAGANRQLAADLSAIRSGSTVRPDVNRAAAATLGPDRLKYLPSNHQLSPFNPLNGYRPPVQH